MKIFSVKRALGLAAIYGVVQYARKQGGFGPMIEGLKAKVTELKDQASEKLGTAADTTSMGSMGSTTRSSTPATSSGYGDSGFGGSYSGGYGSGSGGFGGGSNRH